MGKGATDFCYLLVFHDVFESSLLVAKSLSGIVSEENEVENKPVLQDTVRNVTSISFCFFIWSK